MEKKANNIVNEAEVAEYLEKNPQFFSAHTGLLATMHLPNPHGSGTVSLAERQQAAQREKIHQIERKRQKTQKLSPQQYLAIYQLLTQVAI